MKLSTDIHEIRKTDKSRQLQTSEPSLNLNYVLSGEYRNSLHFQAEINSIMQYRHQTSAGSTKKALPFVCHLLPFVCLNYPLSYPLVSLNKPFIRNRGVTLIELIIVLTIAGVLAALAAPGIQKFVASNRLAAQVNDLLADINSARSDAIKRNTRAGICTSTSGTSCTASGNWANGWLVYYVCPTGDPSGCTAGNNVVVKVHEALSGSNTLSAVQTDVSTSSSSSIDTMTFSKTGAFSSQAFTYTFTLCDPRRNQSRILGITVVGQTSVSSGTC